MSEDPKGEKSNAQICSRSPIPSPSVGLRHRVGRRQGRTGRHVRRERPQLGQCSGRLRFALNTTIEGCREISDEEIELLGDHPHESSSTTSFPAPIHERKALKNNPSPCPFDRSRGGSRHWSRQAIAI